MALTHMLLSVKLFCWFWMLRYMGSKSVASLHTVLIESSLQTKHPKHHYMGPIVAVAVV